VTASERRVIEGIRAHRVRNLPPEDRTVVDAIPVTSVHRTILDEARYLSPQRLRSRLEDLERRELFDLHCFDALLDRNPTRAGAKKLKAAIATLTDAPPWTISDGERDLLELIRQADLPEPSTNVIVEGELVDLVWHHQRLIVELDHPWSHGSRRSFEEDRKRDTKLQLAGYRVIRITHQRLYRDPAGVIADLRTLLATQPRL
jgi:very-short-patch-repair endonuclease